MTGAKDIAPGIGVDSAGNPVIDPTVNVLALVEAANRRQDDLRLAESRHLREIGDLRAHFGGQIRAAEAARIDSIRTIDVGAVTRAAEVATTQASALAGQVAASAEAMRNQVAAAATAASIALEAALKPVQVDIADLRRAQYEAQGKTTAVVETQQKGLSQAALIGIVVGIVGLLLTFVLTGVTIAALVTRGFTS